MNPGQGKILKSLSNRNLFALLLILVIICISCQVTEDMPAEKAGYNEPYRPQFHFSPEANWMNGPNGMVYLDGEYHLFYQYYPDSTVWGPMHWGHAVSRDLLQWEHLPVALYPDSLGYIFSGSVVYDSMNTSGFGEAGNPPLVAVFTYHDPEGERRGTSTYQTQGLAYSLDKGRTWTKYAGNPVLPNPGIRAFRVPKVRWHEGTARWIMTLAVKDRIYFYSSRDLRTWSFESEFGQDRGAHGGVWECPDLFPIIFDGEEYWVLLVSINPGGPAGGSGTQYFVGKFDGHTFSSDQQRTYWLDLGADNYAGVTWANSDRPLFIGWMSNWEYAQVVPTDPWRSAMTLPRELFLFSDRSLDTVRMSLFNREGEFAELVFDGLSGAFYFDRSHAGNNSFSPGFSRIHTGRVPNRHSEYHIRFIKDTSSLEIFISNGEVVLTELFFPDAPLDHFRVTGTSGTLMRDISIHRLSGTW